MEENKLEKLIDSDRESRKFWETLPESLQNKLGDNVDGFKMLKKCAENGMGIRDIHENWEDFDYNNPAASVHESTGLIPSGGDLTAEEFFLYRSIYPLENPPHK